MPALKAKHMLQRTKCCMILALLVVTGLASHDGTDVVTKEESLRAEKTVIADVPEKTNRPN
jgi:hypothetical protein